MNPSLRPFVGAASAILLASCADPYLMDPGAYRGYPAGRVLSSLPPGHRTEVIGGVRYYHHDGRYYRPRGGSYVVVDPPHRYPRNPGYFDRDQRRHGYGTVVRTLPSGYRVVTHRGSRYYRVHDHYYQRRGDGFILVRAPF